MNMTQKPYHSQTLDDIRKKIDALDTRIHDTLKERAELVLEIGKEKHKNNIEIVQPAREARMIRNLLKRNNGALPEMAVVRIWRELVGAVSLLQTGLKVATVYSGERPEYWDLAKDYFGSCLPMSRSETPLSAISALREGRVTFAVVPYPHDGPDNEEEKPWWESLDIDTPNPIQIIVRLPHGDDPSETNPNHRALVLAKTGFDSSDEDNSFIYIECGAHISRGKIVELAQKASLIPLSLSSKKIGEKDETRKHLLEVKGYWQDGKTEIEQLWELLDPEKTQARLKCVGGYPVPATYSKTILPQAQGYPAAPENQN